MGIMKDFDIRIRSGGDDAVGAVNELIAELHRRLLELQDSMPRWIPVTERLPANRQRLIAFFPSEIESVGEATFRNDEENRWLTEHGSWFEATHWMPLPAPPADAK